MPAFRLVSASGDQSFEVPPGRTLVVGRGVASDIAIYDPTISRRHAELVVSDDSVAVTDLGSSNGTCINGARVESGHLNANDSVTFGKVTYRLRTGKSSDDHPAPHLPAPLQHPPLQPDHGPQGGQIVRQLVVSGGVPPCGWRCPHRAFIASTTAPTG